MDDLDLGATIKGFIPGQKVFKRYTLKKILGRGGMGVVWLTMDEELEREVALKFLPEVVALDKESLDELKRETRRNLELTHPHIVRIYDFIQDGRSAAIAMEYVDGASLSALKTDQPDKVFPVAKLAGWVGQICEALHYAHTKAKIVHRDIKPANLMVDARGEIKVTDFGIARSISDSVSRVSAQAGSSGTPVYMSPQQMMGEKPAVSDDVYALGATLYELLTGKPPFYTGNVIVQVQNKVPPSISARREELGVKGDPVPAHWETAIAACLAKEPGDRPKDMATLAELLCATAQPVRGEDQHTSLFLSVEEMVTGGPMKVTRRGGIITLLEEIQVPHGVRSGTMLRVPRLGDPGQNGGEPGDLIVTVQLRDPATPTSPDAFEVLKSMTEQNAAAQAVPEVLVRVAPVSRAWPALVGSAMMLAIALWWLRGVWELIEPENWRRYDYSALLFWASLTATLGGWATVGRLAGSCWLAFLTGVVVACGAYFELGEFLHAHEEHRNGAMMLAFKLTGGMALGLVLGVVNFAIMSRVPGAKRKPGIELFLGLAAGMVVTAGAMFTSTGSAVEELDLGLYSWVVVGGLGWLQALRILMVRVAAPTSAADPTAAAKKSTGWLTAFAATIIVCLAVWYVGLRPIVQDRTAMPKDWDPAALDAMHAVESPSDSAVPSQNADRSEPAHHDDFRPDNDLIVMVRAREEHERERQQAFTALQAEIRALGAATTEPAVSALEQRIQAASWRRDELMREFQERREQRTEALRVAEVQAGIRRVALGPGLLVEFLPVAPGVVGRTGGTLRFTRPFWIAAKPVTQAQWQALMPRDSTPERHRGPELPARMMSWVAAREFCEKLTAQERAAGRLPAGHVYSLPTEAELEFAYAVYSHTPGLSELLARNDPTRRGWAEWTRDAFAPPVSGDLTDPKPVEAAGTRMLTRWTTGSRSSRDSRSGDSGDEMVLRVVLRPER